LKHMWGTRWEVPNLKDFEYSPNSPLMDGFCKTSEIKEAGNATTSRCSVDKKLLSQFNAWGYRCDNKDTTPAPTSDDGSGAGAKGESTTFCKKNWCGKQLLNGDPTKNWVALGFNSLTQCQTYVSTPGDNFLRAVCAVSPKVNLVDPTKCDNFGRCKDCMDDIRDFPDEIEDNLRVIIDASGKCSPNSLLEEGKANAAHGVPIATGGIKIWFLGTTPATLIWTATDTTISDWTKNCGCTDFLLDSTDPVFSAAGTYRIEQCFPEQSLIPSKCTGAPAYEVEATWEDNKTPVEFSHQFRPLVDAGYLVCDASLKCPPSSTCCIWPWGGTVWKDCLGADAALFPDCGKVI